MAGNRRSRIASLVFVSLLLLLSPWPPRAAGLNWFGALGRWGTTLSLSHSLLERVANARAERGDLSGAARARAMAHKLELLGGGAGSGGIWSLCWDYVRNYSWRGGPAFGGAEIYRAAGELVAALQELGQMRSDAERARWVARNYTKMVSAASAILRRFAQAFSRSGALREAVMMLQREVVDGELLRDCLQVGARDLEGLARVARDLFSSYSTASSASPDRDYEL